LLPINNNLESKLINSPIKRQTGYLLKLTQLYAAYKKLTSLIKNIHSLKVKGWKRYHASGYQNQAGIVISDKGHFKFLKNGKKRQRKPHYHNKMEQRMSL
jgi:hypothetical protein